jgi:hypothetical protein
MRGYNCDLMEITREMIEKKAYELYVARGAQHGGDVGDWLEAERLLRDGKPVEVKPSRATPATSSKRVSANKTTRRR